MASKNAGGKAPATAALKPTKEDGLERVTVSLHGADTDRINALEDYLTELGHRERNRSLLVKVALRGLDFTPQLIEHLESAKAADGRRERSPKGPPRGTTKKKSRAPRPTASVGVERVTLSLHGPDCERIDEIEAYLRALGRRESNRSLLVKVALRGVALTPKVVEHLEAARADDGRRRKSGR